MADTVTSVSTSGYATHNSIGEHEISIDSRERDGPNPTATLLAAYASCFVVGLKIAGKDRGIADLGEIEIAVTGRRDETGNLEAIEFELAMEASMDPSERTAVVDRALETCHVGNALRDDLEASVTVVESEPR